MNTTLRNGRMACRHLSLETSFLSQNTVGIHSHSLHCVLVQVYSLDFQAPDHSQLPNKTFHFTILPFQVFSWNLTPPLKKLSFFAAPTLFMSWQLWAYSGYKAWKQPTGSYIPWCKQDKQLLGAPVIYQVGCWPTHESMNKAIEIFIYFWRPVCPDYRGPTGMGKTETSLLTGADETSCTLRRSWDEGQNTIVF